MNENPSRMVYVIDRSLRTKLSWPMEKDEDVITADAPGHTFASIIGICGRTQHWALLAFQN